MKRISLGWLEKIPVADLIEIAPPMDVEEFDRDDYQDFGFFVDVRRPEDFLQRIQIVWHEDPQTWKKLGGKKIYRVCVVYFDENGKPIFRSKSFPVHLKRRTH